MSTKIQPIQVLRLVGLLPKHLQQEFTKEAYVDTKPTEDGFVPDTDRIYDHSLGLSWLTKHNIPNTLDELEAQRQYIFQTMVSGSEEYNVGELIVVFPNIVYSTSDIKNNLMVLEVMTELKFPAMTDLMTSYNNDIRAAGFETEAMVALRYALQTYVADGKIKVHDAGYRVYSASDTYQFQSRFTDPEETKLSFLDHVRNHRKG